MQLPKPLLRNNPRAYKNNFGHVLVLAGSPRMLGAAALTSLAAMRSGAGLVTVGIPKSLNLTLQKKNSNVVMTWPLAETKEQTLSLSAFSKIQKSYSKFSAIAIGPGLSTNLNTQKLILKIIATSPIPLVIDADALNALVGHLDILKKTKTPKILTPHPGEIARLIGKSTKFIENNREQISKDFVKHNSCMLVLKGYRTIIAAAGHKTCVNKTGNVGMATAGSGDVLTGMIAAFLGQGLSVFEAAKWGVYLHGKAGDLAAHEKGKVSMIAEDIIENISQSINGTS